MLTYNIREICAARGIERPFSYLVKNGFTYGVAARLVRNEPLSIRLDHIEQLCILLYCTPDDLITWKPTKDKPIPPDHPLQRLKKDQALTDLYGTLKTLPLDRLNEVADFIRSGTEDKQ